MKRLILNNFYITERTELLDRSFVVFGDALRVRTTILDEFPSHVQRLNSKNRAFSQENTVKNQYFCGILLLSCNHDFS